MSQLTQGEISYSQTVNLGDYNSKKAEAKIGYSIADGASEADAKAMIDKAGQVAFSKVVELLGLPSKPGIGKNSPAPAAEPAPAPAATGKTKADLAAEAAAPAAAKLPRAKKPPAADPADIEEPAKPAAKDPADLDDGFDPVPEKKVEAPAKVTDEELTSAMTRRNAVIKNAALIRALVAEFVAHPGRAIDIPQERRKEFLDKLAALGA